MSDALVDVNHVSKRFCRSLKQSLWYGVKDITAGLCGLPTGGSELRPGEFWAVNDVSFELHRGESLGLIGANGAGKSTLLKMLNGLIKPDAGRIRIRGRVGALIELGAGFHPLLSGRENIYVNAAILGMSKSETDRRLDEIIAFADIGNAIDAPVKSYSSGMRVRLGFAVAAHFEPDILLIDEVLAVGDLAFRLKCYRVIAELRRGGTAIILVSHSEQLVKATCDRGLVLYGGECLLVGDINSAFLKYSLVSNSRCRSVKPAAGFHVGDSYEDMAGPKIVAVHWQDPSGQTMPHLVSGRPASLVVMLRSPVRLKGIGLFVGVRRVDSPELMAMAFSTRDGIGEIRVDSPNMAVQLTWDTCCLSPGAYDMKIRLDQPPFEVLDVLDWGIVQFDVSLAPDDASQIAFVYQPHRWNVCETETPEPFTMTEEHMVIPTAEERTKR